MQGLERASNSKFMLIIRHGEIDNPQGLVYNRDSRMEPGDVVHLSSRGREQMQTLGELIAERGFKVKRIVVSPETRAQESAECLVQGHDFPDIEIEEGLDDAFASGSYLTWMSSEALSPTEGLGYEQPQGVAERMREVFDRVITDLEVGEKVGESGVLISHGDSISYLLHSVMNNGHLPGPQELRNSFYPEKGTGFIVILGSNNQAVSHYPFNSQDFLCNL